MRDAHEKLRILHVAESYPPHYGGGAAITTREVCRELAASGHQVQVLTIESRDAPPFRMTSEDDTGVRVHRLNLPYFRDKDPDGVLLDLKQWRTHQSHVAAILDEFLSHWVPDIVDYHTTRPLG